MLSILRDHFATFGLRARYQRLLQERLLELAESPRAVAEEGGDWQLLGGGKSPVSEVRRASIRDRARRAVRENPHACNILRLLQAYVTGPGLQLSHQPRASANDIPDGSEMLVAAADQIWRAFQRRNCRHYSFQEHARRTWRDGECFIRRFSSTDGAPSVRFVDPEWIVASPDAPGSQGIVTARHDVEEPIAYLQSRPGAPQEIERVAAEEMLQTRIGVDSNEKRGISLFAPLLDPLDGYEKWMETEMLARKLQSSIVLWRKVQGSPQMADGLADQAGHYGSSGREGRRERFAPGTILTTNHGTDIQFLQPNTNFGDAVPLGRMVLLSIAAGAGLPEFMLTADASNGNFASTMVAEGPAVKFFQSEQQFFAGEFTRIWRWVMQDAIEQRQLPEEFFGQVDVRWSFPQLVNRDRSKERMADVRLVEAGVLSRAEVARRDGVEPEIMQAELQSEQPG
ncbi:phage portal protein [Planctomicrobium piriforme]|uniref:Capsid protein n=1 Tax=Planctomicrobium piriforme TaxID=1576369 RepID=A0A1I3D086_9PLAN|nr:phage portal protein [Planctomicrobium piriforme]SFH80180.1 capsid protein [Planctomicrobium piriforme]